MVLGNKLRLSTIDLTEQIDHAMHVAKKQLQKLLVAANMKREKVVSNLDKEAPAALGSGKANCTLSSYATDSTMGMNKGHFVAAVLPFACASSYLPTPWRCLFLKTDFLCLKSYYFS